MISDHTLFLVMMTIRKYSNTEVLVTFNKMNTNQPKSSVFKSEKMVLESHKSCKSFKTMQVEI